MLLPLTALSDKYMCYWQLTKLQKQDLIKITKQSNYNPHGTGYFCLDCKEHQTYLDAVKAVEKIKTHMGHFVLSHSRLASTGARTEQNVQPVRTRSHVFAHNGDCSNVARTHDRMRLLDKDLSDSVVMAVDLQYRRSVKDEPLTWGEIKEIFAEYGKADFIGNYVLVTKEGVYWHISSGSWKIDHTDFIIDTSGYMGSKGWIKIDNLLDEKYVTEEFEEFNQYRYTKYDAYGWHGNYESKVTQTYNYDLDLNGMSEWQKQRMQTFLKAHTTIKGFNPQKATVDQDEEYMEALITLENAYSKGSVHGCIRCGSLVYCTSYYCDTIYYYNCSDCGKGKVSMGARHVVIWSNENPYYLDHKDKKIGIWANLNDALVNYLYSLGVGFQPTILWDDPRYTETTPKKEKETN